MDIGRLFSDSNYLLKELDFFIKKGQVKSIESNPELVRAHMKKTRHNLAFYSINQDHETFQDWMIVALYYTLYHAALALIKNRRFSSKNHYATILILIKEYSISKDDAELIDNLSIGKEDAQLYTSLKDDRHDASYATSVKFSKELILAYEARVKDFVNKADLIVSDSSRFSGA
ncbi:MAG: HEPN domain-containing protein [Nanobdellota archaeon]